MPVNSTGFFVPGILRGLPKPCSKQLVQLFYIMVFYLIYFKGTKYRSYKKIFIFSRKESPAIRAQLFFSAAVHVLEMGL